MPRKNSASRDFSSGKRALLKAKPAQRAQAHTAAALQAGDPDRVDEIGTQVALPDRLLAIGRSDVMRPAERCPKISTFDA